MSDKEYDILNKLQRWLPALGVFYLALAQIWDIPYGEQVNSTIVALATLLGATLEIASARYYKAKSDGLPSEILPLDVFSEEPVILAEQGAQSSTDGMEVVSGDGED